jgi:hypothetical protein
MKYNGQVTGDEMGRVCNMNEGEEECIQEARKKEP